MCNCNVCVELKRLNEIIELIPHKEDKEYLEDFVDKYLDICMELDFFKFDSEEVQTYTKTFLGEEQYEKFKEFVRKEKGIN